MKELALTLARPFVWTYNKTHWFTDAEAWGIYRFFAILEAVGWTLLILAIAYRYTGWPHADSVVSFAGHIHGIGFGLYFIFTLLVARSMEWGIWRVGTAIVAGMPPYGSLIFEQIMAWHRKKVPPTVKPPKGSDE
jgi:integral membrane protein